MDHTIQFYYKMNLFRNRYLIIICFLIAFLPLTHRCTDVKEKETVVARVDGRPIFISTFSRALMDRLQYSTVQTQDTPELRKQVIRDLATRLFLSDLARNAKLAERPEFCKAMTAESTVVILHGLWQEEIGNTYKPEDIPEQELQTAYKKMAVKFHVRHLFAASRPGIDSLYRQLQKGANFSQLARACFRDSSLKKNSGDLGFLSWGDFDDLNLENAVFDMQVGQYSKPVESKYGWHILYLENLTYNPILTEQNYLIHRTSIANRLWRRQIKQKSDERIKEIMQAKEVRMNVPLIIELEKEQRRLPNNGLIQFSDFGLVGDSPLENLLSTRRDAVIASYTGGRWTVGDFRQHLSTVSPEALSHGLYRAVAMSLRNYFLLQLAREKRIAEIENVRSEIEDKRTHLLSAFYTSEYADTCTFNDDDYRRYYAEHKNQFLRDRQMHVLEILLKSEKEAYRIRSLINNESEFRQMAKRHTRRPGFQEKEGDLGFLFRGDYGEIGHFAFQLQAGVARTPVVRHKDGYSLLMVVESRNVYVPFETAKGEIAIVMQQQKKSFAWEKLQATYVDTQKITVHDSLLNRCFFPWRKKTSATNTHLN